MCFLMKTNKTVSIDVDLVKWAKEHIPDLSNFVEESIKKKMEEKANASKKE